MYEVKRRALSREFDVYFKFNNGEIGLIRHTLEENGLRETSHGNWNLLWSIGPIKEEVYKELKPYQKVSKLKRFLKFNSQLRTRKY